MKTKNKKEDEAKQDIKQNDKLLKLQQDFNQTFATPQGKRVLIRIMSECGFHDPSVTMNNQSMDINLQATLYNEARRNVYLSIRKLIKPDILREIENPLGEDE